MRRPDDLITMFVTRLHHAATEQPRQDDTPLGKALREEQTLELAAEWEALRSIWPSTEASIERFWDHIRTELGGAAERTLMLRLYDQKLFI